MKIENANRLILRQLRKFPDDLLYTSKGICEFIQLVNDTYNSFDDERRLITRIDDLSSKEMQRINDELNDKNEFLDSFNHGMAHDIKNHMSNIIGLVAMLKKYHSRNDLNVITTIIEKLELSSNQLTSIVQGFLYLSRAESNIDNQFVVIKEDELINAIKSETLFLTLDKSSVINYNMQLNNLFFSFHVIKIILVNLVSNSLKFSKKKETIHINVSVKHDSEKMELTVSDNGIGMNLKDPKNKIFELFNRTGNSKMVRGTGVGLFMIKKITDRHKGSVKVISEPQVGTTFLITIPLK